MRHFRNGTALAVGLALFAAVATVWAQDRDRAAPKPETVMREGLAPTRTHEQGTAQVSIFAEGDNGWLGKLRVSSGASVPRHRDPTEEYLFVLRGEGELNVAGTKRTLGPGASVRLPAEAPVGFSNGPRTFTAIQFFAGPESGDKYSTWKMGKPTIGESAKGKRKISTTRAQLKGATIRRSPDGQTEVATLAAGENAWMGILWLGPGATVPENSHESEEYLYVLSGTGKLSVGETTYNLEPNTGVLIPAGTKSTFENGESVLKVLQFFAGAEPAAKYRDWSTVQSPSIRPSAPSGTKTVGGIELK
ncbi:MAG: cupin domain-containing protein [Bradymonadaceae bacterium]